MNWYKKTTKFASISFYIEDSHKVAQPTNLLEICFDITKFIYYVKNLKGLKIRQDSVAPDTSHSRFDEPTGTINFYLTDERVDKAFVDSLIHDYNEYKFPSIEIKVGDQEKSGVSDFDVVRLHVTKNDTFDLEELPSINLVNTNAAMLLNLLQANGVNVDPNEFSGVINVDELKAALNRIEQEEYQLPAYTRDTEISEEPGKAKLHDFGVDVSRIKRYLDGLKIIAQYIDNNNLTNRNIVFA